MTCVDWRTCAPIEVAPLLAAETDAWRRQLDWDVTEAWRVVEPARRAGQLPGFVVRDDAGRVTGWTAFLLHRTSLQVLALVALDPAAVDTLVDAILTAPEAALAESVIFCVRGSTPHLQQTLAAHGFQVDPYRYLTLDLTTAGHDRGPSHGGVSERPGMRAWMDDGRGLADLCARAYADSKEIRAFAPSGSHDEWRDYVDSLLSGPGCGWFRPELSYVVPEAHGCALAGAVLVTDLGLSTAHVAQIVVDPSSRGRGVAGDLMRVVARSALAGGYRRVTLLVSGANRPAAAVYARLGFRDRTSFVVATRSQPGSLTGPFATSATARRATGTD